jgi:hypothetical protein
MPLTFNLLAPWGHALERASGYLIELLKSGIGGPRRRCHADRNRGRDECFSHFDFTFVFAGV